MPVRRFAKYLVLLAAVACCNAVQAAESAQPDTLALYNELKAFHLTGKSVAVKELAIRQGPVEMAFSGEFYPARLASGQMYGAVFTGNGRLHAAPWNDFEKQSVRRFLGADNVDATFTRAVLRFTDGTGDLLAGPAGSDAAAGEAQKLADGLEPRMIRETGLNLSARMAQSILHREQPGLFVAEFSGGDHKRFALILDHQCRGIEDVFALDAGEKGVLYRNQGPEFGNDIWMAFYDNEEVKRGMVAYSDSFDEVNVPAYRMGVDLRSVPHRLAVDAQMDLIARREGVRLVDFRLNEDLDDFDNERKKKGARVSNASLADGTPLRFIQDEWDKAVWVEMPHALRKGERLTVKLKFEAKDCFYTWSDAFHYPIVNESWYPRHRDLELSQFELTFHHKPKTQVISVGKLAGEPARQGDEMITRWQTSMPLAMATFAVGPFDLQSENIKTGGREVIVDYYSARADYTTQGWGTPIKKDFMLAELGNTLNFFSAMFNDYPYPRLGAVFSPRPFGQGFPTLLLLPSRGTDHTWDFAFIAHECSHQWWGQMVGWRSYRDQWLSEGFADYSGILYTATRLKTKDSGELVDHMRRTLMNPPHTDVGLASGKLYEVGPLIYGHRLSSRRTGGAYTALIYSKGALVLRMLHFLMTDPATGDGSGFYSLMKDFTAQYKDKLASTDDFFRVANTHFADSPIAKRFGMKNLDWFQREWVYGTDMPSYRLEYKLEPRPGGGQILNGQLIQDGVGENWFMPLPIVVETKKGQKMIAVVAARGPNTPLKLGLPDDVKRVALDPDRWVLSGKTSEQQHH